MLQQGLLVMVVGMGTVFFVLATLVLFMTLLPWLARGSGRTLPQSPGSPSAPEADEEAAAVAAAVSAYLKRSARP